MGSEAFQECVELYILEMPLKYGHLKCWVFFYCSELSEGAAAFESPCLPSSHTQPRLLCLLRNWRRALVEQKRAKGEKEKS